LRKRRTYSVNWEATKAAGFKDSKSWVHRSGRVFLGPKDMEELRTKCFERSKGFCEMVNKHGIRCERNISWTTFQMHHSPPRSRGGSDELDKVVAACQRCHKPEHPQVRWSRK
jgi:hypothetical protein